ncbi:MAG: hypothetical protein AAFV53_34000, partial [Myxococcota bacterium]
RLPLAIELAAARCRLFSPRALRARLQRSLQVLRDDRRDRIDRHKTLYSALDWSWSLLTPTTQRAFAQLSVIEGSADVAAAEAMLSLPDEVDPLTVLEALVDHSLLRLDNDRLQMLAVVRDYARHKLDAFEEVEQARARHRAWFVRAAAEWAREREGAQAWEIIEAVRQDRDNLNAALDAVSCAADAAHLISGLHIAWEVDSLRSDEADVAIRALSRFHGPAQVEGAWPLVRMLIDIGRNQEAMDWIARVRDLAQTPAQRLRAAHMHAVAAEQNSDLHLAIQRHRAALQVPADDPTVRGRVYIDLTVDLRIVGERAAAQRVLEQGLDWARRRDVPYIELDMDGFRVTSMASDGAYEASIALAQRQIAVYRAHGSSDPIAHFTGIIGINMTRSGRPREGLLYLQEAVERTQKSGRTFLLARILLQRARARWTIRDFSGAAADATASRRLALRCGDIPLTTLARIVEADTLLEMDCLEQALGVSATARQEAAQQDMPVTRARAARAGVRILLRLGEPDAAQQACEDAIAAAGHTLRPVMLAWRAVIAHLQGAPHNTHLDDARAALQPHASDRAPEGFVSLVDAVLNDKDDLTVPRRLLAQGWQPALSSALPAVIAARDGHPPPEDTFSEGRILAELAYVAPRPSTSDATP